MGSTSRPEPFRSDRVVDEASIRTMGARYPNRKTSQPQPTVLRNNSAAFALGYGYLWLLSRTHSGDIPVNSIWHGNETKRDEKKRKENDTQATSSVTAYRPGRLKRKGQ